MAVEDASFNTVILSISLGFNAVNAPEEIGEPSNINNGSELLLIELTPRKRICTVPLGSPLGVNTCKPATCPCKASPMFATGFFSSFSPLTAVTEPTTDPSFLLEPYPTITTSSNKAASAFNTIFKLGLIATSCVCIPMYETCKVFAELQYSY